jgi:hypothetical protein
MRILNAILLLTLCAFASTKVNACNPPTITITSSPLNPSVCTGTPVILNAVASGGAPVSWSGGVLNNVPFAPPLAVTIYTVTAGSVGCFSTSTVAVTAWPAPPLPIVVPTFNYGLGAACPGGTANVSVTNSNQFQTLSIAGPGIPSTTFVPPYSFTFTAAGIYTVTGTNSNGCTRVSTFMAKPASIALNVPSVAMYTNCTAVATATTNAPATFTWTPAGVASTSTTTTSTVNQAAYANSVFTVTAAVGSCNVSATLPVNVRTPLITTKRPGLPILVHYPTPATTPLCNYETMTLSVASTSVLSGSTYTWAGPAGFSATTSTCTVNPSATGVYTLTVSKGGCSITRSVLLNEEIPVVVPVSPNPQNECVSATTGILYFGYAGYSNYKVNGAAVASHDPVILNRSVAGSSVYTVSLSSSIGCAYTATKTVNVLAPPAISAIVTPVGNSLCAGSTLTINAAVAGGTTYTLSNGTTNTTGVFNPTPTVGLNTYTITAQNSVPGCIGTAVVSKTISFVPKPSNLVVTANLNPVCAGSLVTYTGSATNSTSIKFSTMNGGCSNCYSSPYSFTAGNSQMTPTGMTAFNTVGGLTCSSSITTYNVGTVNPAPSISVSPLSFALPLGLLGTFSITAAAGTTYTVAGPGSPATITSGSNITFTTSIGGTYTITAVNSTTGCASTATVTHFVFPPMMPRLAENPVATEFGSKIQSCELYPNPAAQQANIILHSTTAHNVSMQMYDITGKVAYDANFMTSIGEQAHAIPVHSLRNGSYYIVVQSENGGEKFIKQLSVIN